MVLAHTSACEINAQAIETQQISKQTAVNRTLSRSHFA
jgi:hypothetical protein